MGNYNLHKIKIKLYRAYMLATKWQLSKRKKYNKNKKKKEKGNRQLAGDLEK